MTWRLQIRPAAKREFDEAADWYNDRDPDVADRFTFAIEQGLEGIRARPLMFPLVFAERVRRARIKRFPYSIYFLIKDAQVVILSIFHDKRDPTIWRGRIG